MRNKKVRRDEVIIRAVSVGTDLTGAPAPYRYEILKGEVVGINRISWEEATENLGLCL